MFSSIAPISLTEKVKLLKGDDRDAVGRLEAAASTVRLPGESSREAFLRVPPFPGARLKSLVELPLASEDPGELLELVRRLRVGGTYWSAQPELPADYVLVRTVAALDLAEKLAGGRSVVLWPAHGAAPDPTPARLITGDCDPWHMLSPASAVLLEADDELRLIAALLGIAAHIYDPEDRKVVLDVGEPSAMLGEEIGPTAFENPFTGEPMSAREAVELCGFWRRLIDSNRDISGGIGFAFWKQDHVAPLLWGGSHAFRFLRPADFKAGASVAVWRAKASPDALAHFERGETSLIEVEDGFLRSRGLGADCIPPLSITVDRQGAYFDPSQPSELEDLLQTGEFDAQLLSRARELRRLIVEAGLGKYGLATDVLDRPAAERRHVLVPGQVEDDRAVQTGGCGLVSNLELLAKVREEAPDAYILYKPHPDVLAGHRRGMIPDRTALQYADEVISGTAIAPLVEMVDEVHVNTSLAGFEALLREKAVTTYGVPFFAGWGLTRDLGPVPARRSAKRTLDELVAAALLLYPRYLDPVTGLPCPAEIVVSRLSVCEESDAGLIVGMRRLQGKFMRRLRSLVQ